MRHASDYKNNHEEKTYIIQDGQPVIKEWSEVRVGDIIMVLKDEMFPADLILLSSSN